MSRGVIVESSPRYMLSPLAPYRMRMVRPRAKLVAVLRDPTERYARTYRARVSLVLRVSFGREGCGGDFRDPGEKNHVADCC